MDSAILSISHSPLAVMDTAGGPTSHPIDANVQRKITLLTRPSPQQLTSNPVAVATTTVVSGGVVGVGSTTGPTLIQTIAANPLSSDIQSSGVTGLQQAFLSAAAAVAGSGTPIPGRATRGTRVVSVD